MKQISKSAIAIAIISVIGFIINLSAYLPGFMSPDSFEQYRQSYTHHYNDWHPPVMAFVWSILNNIYQGPEVMLVLQLALLWVAYYFFAIAINNKFWQIVVLCLFAVSPFLQNFAGYIIKDTQMAFSWLLVIALLFNAIVKQQRLSFGIVFLALLLLIYGALLRPNALPGYIPILILLVWVAYPKHKIIVRCFILITLLLITVVLQRSLPQILDAEKQYAENKLYLHDLTGIYKVTGKNVFPEVLFQTNKLDTSYLKEKYHPATFDDIWWNADNKILLPDTNQIVANDIKYAWVSAIKQYPDVYFNNRWQGFLYYLRIKKRSDFYCNYYMYIYPDPNEYGYTPRNSNFFYHIYQEMMIAQKDMFYMKAWFWMLMNFLMVLLIPLFKDKSLKLYYSCIILSGVLYKLPDIFVFQVDTDYRYFYWNTIVCCVGILLLSIRGKLPQCEK